MLKQISITVVLTILLIANNNLLAQSQADKDPGFRFLPVLDEDYDLGLTLSLKTGIMNLSNVNSGTHLLGGLEAAFNCLMFKPAVGSIRAQFSYNRYEDSDYTIHSIELNPYYMLNVTERLSIGGGPGIGYLIPEGNLENVWALQVGLGASYDIGLVAIGLEARYQWQTEDQQNSNTSELDNFRTTLKFGINL